MAPTNDSKKFSKGNFDCFSFRFHPAIAAMMSRKHAALAAKIQLAPK